MRNQTATKLAIAGVVAILFAGFVLRAAMRLAATAMHSLLGAVLVIILIAWVVAKMR